MDRINVKKQVDIDKIIIKKQAEKLFEKAQEGGNMVFEIMMSYTFGLLKSRMTAEDVECMEKYYKALMSVRKDRETAKKKEGE